MTSHVFLFLPSPPSCTLCDHLMFTTRKHSQHSFSLLETRGTFPKKADTMFGHIGLMLVQMWYSR